MIFDQYSRYRAVALSCENLIKSFKNSEKTTIIDVGSGPYKLLGKFLENSIITYLDPLLADQTASSSNEKLVPKSIFDENIDFKDHTSKIVVSIDTLEHIPSNLRLEFLEKLYKLSEHSLVLSFPCNDTPESADVDQHVNNFFKSNFGEDYSWLSEHFEFGLPSTEETVDFFRKKGLHVKTFRQGNCHWLKEILPTVLALNEFDFLAKEIEIQSEYFNNFIAPFDIGTNGYRTVLIASKENFEIENIIPKNQPLVADLNQRIAKIKSDLMENTFFQALSKLRLQKNELFNLQVKTVEIGEWGLILQSRIKELENQASTITHDLDN